MFTGQERLYHLVCAVCGEDPDGDAIPWQAVCEACFTRIEWEGYWHGIRGVPEIREEPSDLVFTRRIVPGIGEGSNRLRVVQPITEASGSRWVGLTVGGALVELDLDSGAAHPITHIEPTELDLTIPVTLACSPDGAFVCVAQTLGNHGVVIERASARRTMRLQRDDYHNDVSPFPVAFVVREGRTLLVHSAEWNRLDISDPATGELLTPRESPVYQKERPPHYRDYFHGRLLVAPNQDLIADDGWIWHPVGDVTVFSVQRWREENVWESEDGPTLRSLIWRNYFWGGPMCWVDETTLAVWGYGRDDEWLIPAVCLFDAVSGEERGWFPGPEVAPPAGREWRDKLADFGGRLIFDRYLFAISEQFGTAVWNHQTGARLLQDPNFAPIAYHPGTREFLTILADGMLQLSRLHSSPHA